MTGRRASLWIALLAGCPDRSDDTGAGEELDTAELHGDGTRFATTPVAGATGKMVGTEVGMNFGFVVVAAAPVAGNTGTVAVAEPGWGTSGLPAVRVLAPITAAAAGTPTMTVVHDDGYLGRAAALIRLEDGTQAWAVAFHEPDTHGGLCAWSADRVGTQDLTTADACFPPFDSGVLKRPESELTSDIDLDGDGSRDLLMGGMAPGANDEGIAALWLKPGPLTYDSFDNSPELLLTMSGDSAVAHRVRPAGDLTGDGYADIAASDSEATTDAAEYSGQVRIVAGGSNASDWTALDGIDGDTYDASTGAGLASLDIDHDGQLDLCVGAPLDGTAGDRAGRVGCFYGPITGRQSLGDAPIVYLAEAPNSFFGFDLAALDLDHDGDQELAVGRPGDPYFGYPYPGLVYLFDPSDGGEEPLGVLAGDAGDGLGYALAAADTDGDGTDDLLAGAPWHDSATGAAYLVLGSAGAW